MVGIPSVPSEQAFSVAGDIVTKKWNSMVGSTIKLLMLTKAWLGLPEVEAWEEVEETRGKMGTMRQIQKEMVNPSKRWTLG